MTQESLGVPAPGLREPEHFAFYVRGVPATAGSKRGIPIYRGKKGEPRVFTGRVAVVDSTKDEKRQNWRLAVQATASATWTRPPLEGPLELSVTFVMPRPKHLARKRVWPTTRPDATKLLRALEDALTGLLWRDDAQVVKQHATKVYESEPRDSGPDRCVPGALVVVTPLGTEGR